MTPWNRGRDEIRLLLEQGDVETVLPSDVFPERLLLESERALKSAELIADEDPGGALTLAYDAARKSAAALMSAQGLRPTSRGGHVAVQGAVIAQFDGPFRGFPRARRRRNDHAYPQADSARITHADASEIMEFAEQCIEAARTLLRSGRVTPWRG